MMNVCMYVCMLSLRFTMYTAMLVSVNINENADELKKNYMFVRDA